MADQLIVVPPGGAYLQPGRDDEVIATLAARQHGVVAYRQLLALDIGRKAIEHRVGVGRLHRVRRGVYAVGHPALTRHGRWMAAVLSAGPGAVLSHRSAAELQRMLDPWGGTVHVTVPRRLRQRQGLRFHFGDLADDEIVEVDGIPATSPARTIFDLAGSSRSETTRRAFDEATFLGLSSPAGLPVLLERHPRPPGMALLRRLVTRGGHQRTRTMMEIAFQDFCDERRIPRPDLTNVRRTIHGRRIEADAVYLAARLIVELDDGSHRTDRRFDDDRARDRANLVDDWRTVRITNRHLDHERDELAADLVALLGRRS